MSKPVQVRRDVYPAMFAQIDDNNPVDIPLLVGTKGMLPAIANHQRLPDVAVDLANMQYETGGRLSTGLGYQFITTNGAVVLGVEVYRLDNTRITIIVTETGLNYRLGVDSTQYSFTGPTFSGLFAWDRFTFTAWGDKVLCTNPVVGMFEIDLVAKTYTKITAAPQDAQFIAVFNGRVLVSGLVSQPRRVQWSAKFSSSDWTGLGSGFEDLQPTNVKSQNYPLVVQPVSNTSALLYRQSSCDLMSATDRFDAPFVFSELHRDLPCFCPFSVTNTRHGVVSISASDLYLTNTSGYQVFGQGLVTQAIRGVPTATDLARMPTKQWLGKYHPGLDEFWLVTESETFRYQFGYQSWVRFVPDVNSIYRVVDVCPSEAGYYTAYQSLAGTYSTLTGTLDSSTGTTRADMTVMCSDGTTLNYSADLSGAFTAPGRGYVGATIETSDIELAVRNKQLTVTELEFEYEVDVASQTYTVQYSIDQGANWSTYGTIVSSGATTIPRLRIIQKVITAKQVRFRVNIPTESYRARFNYITLRGVAGARSSPYGNS